MDVGEVDTASNGTLRPAHAEIENYLRGLIAAGQGRDRPLPTDRALAAQFGVSRMTARQAYQRLVSSGIVVRQPAIGSFVAPRVVEELERLGHGNLQRWEQQGFTTEVRVLRYEVRAAPEDVAGRLEVAAGSRLTYMEWLRLADGVPVIWDQRWVAADLFGRIDVGAIGRRSLSHLLFAQGIPLGRFENVMLARVAEEPEAAPLGIQPGDMVVARETIFRDRDQHPILSGLSVYPAGRVAFRQVGTLTLDEAPA